MAGGPVTRGPSPPPGACEALKHLDGTCMCPVCPQAISKTRDPHTGRQLLHQPSPSPATGWHAHRAHRSCRVGPPCTGGRLGPGAIAGRRQTGGCLLRAGVWETRWFHSNVFASDPIGTKCPHVQRAALPATSEPTSAPTPTQLEPTRTPGPWEQPADGPRWGLGAVTTHQGRRRGREAAKAPPGGATSCPREAISSAEQSPRQGSASPGRVDAGCRACQTSSVL